MGRRPPGPLLWALLLPGLARGLEVPDAAQRPTAAVAPSAAAGPPPSQAEPKGSVVDVLNARFKNGHPTDDLAAAGVLVHQFHNGADSDWRPWMPCPDTCYGGPCWCSKFNDRFSCSIVSVKTLSKKGDVGMYSVQNAGFVLRPAANKVNCAYPADGGSESKSCKDEAGCVPGCGSKWCSSMQNFLVMCVMVPRGKIGVSCLSRVAMGPASSFPSGTQTSRTLPGSCVSIRCEFDPAVPNNMDTSCAWHPEELSRVLTLQEGARSAYNEVRAGQRVGYII